MGDLFDSFNGDFDIQKEHINGLGDYVVTAGLTENGILGKTDVNARLFDEKTITIDMFGFAFYRQFKYKIVTHARVFSLKPKFKLTGNQGLFLTNSLYFINKKFGYENMCAWAKIKSEKIQLPTKNGKIDFEFMEQFIVELEAQRIVKLETYLAETGLKNYILTVEEKQALEDFENGKIEWGEFNLERLFDVVGTKSLDSNAIDFTEDGVNFVGRTFENNGVQGKIQKRDFEPNDPFTLTATVIGNYKYVKFQVEPYYCSQNINKLTPKSVVSLWNKKIAYYFATNIQKFVSLYNNQQGGYKLDDIKKHIITIPTQNQQPDYAIMETLISAIQKLVIKDVVLYVDRKVAATKSRS